MSVNQLQGSITFIHHDKDYVTIEYEANNKTKSINGLIGELVQQKWIAEKIIKKIQHFRIGDQVSFIIVPSAKGDKMVADCITFLYNNAFTNMVQRAAVENKFVGYLKDVNGKFFVKETSSYISFPLLISPWEAAPPAGFVNEPVFFQLDNVDHPDKVTASLCKHHFIAAYHKASMHFEKQTPVTATVTATKTYSVSVALFNGEMEARIKFDKSNDAVQQLTPGAELQVMINYLSPFKIVVAPI